MGVSFNPFRSNEECPICLETLSNTFSVAHGSRDENHKNGERHPMHASCIVKWLSHHSTCPVCKEDLDPSSLLSWKDRSIKEFKYMIPDVLIGVGLGGTCLLIRLLGRWVFETPSKFETRSGRSVLEPVALFLNTGTILFVYVLAATVMIREIYQKIGGSRTFAAVKGAGAGGAGGLVTGISVHGITSMGMSTTLNRTMPLMMLSGALMAGAANRKWKII